MTPDEEVRVRVIALPQEYGWRLTPDGEAALDASMRAEPTVPIPRAAVVRVTEESRRELLAARAHLARERAAAAEAVELARRRRRSTEIDGAPPTLI